MDGVPSNIMSGLLDGPPLSQGDRPRKMSALGWYAMIFAGVPTKICSLMCGIGIGA